MKKLILAFTFFSLIALFTGCSKAEPQPMAGSIYTAEYDTWGETALQFAINEMGLTGSAYRVSMYKKQIVSGTNHFFTAKIGDSSYEIKVYEDLNGNLKLDYYKEIN